MFNRIDYKHKPKPILLSKGNAKYSKLQKEMNEPPKEYNTIKKMIESNENNIEKITRSVETKDVKLIPHQKKKY